jgi:Na+/melibiose symporter-like transporter
MVRIQQIYLGVVIAAILTSSLAPDANAVYRQYVVRESHTGPDIPTIALQIVAAIFVIAAFFYGARYSRPPSFRAGIILAALTAGLLFGTQLLPFFL